MKKYISILLFSFLAFSVSAQVEYDDELPENTDDEEFVGFTKKKKEREKKDLSRWKIGGDFGFSATQFSTFVELSPLVGYEVVDDRLEFGGGIIYQFTNVRRDFQDIFGNVFLKGKINVIGGRTYGRVFVWEGLFAQVEGILINYREKPDRQDRLIKLTIGNALAGVGYRYDISEKVHTIFSVSTNLIINPLYPRRTIIPRIGFQFSL